MPFVLKYVLPSGKVVGYHADSCCTIGSREDAKVYGLGSARDNTPEHQIPIVKKNFAFVWNFEDGEYGKDPVWENTPLDQIQIVAEAA